MIAHMYTNIRTGILIWNAYDYNVISQDYIERFANNIKNHIEQGRMNEFF